LARLVGIVGARNQAFIAGTRIAVRNILEFFNAGFSIEEIKQQYLTLTIKDIEAAISHGKAA
jgi:uncharacterized protein (DUF433 family)